MTPDDKPIVVKVTDEGRAAFEATVPRLVRRQATLLILLGGILVAIGLLIVTMIIVDLGFSMRVSVLAVLLLAVPVCLIVVGIRRLRRSPSFRALAVTITHEHVIFPAYERVMLMDRSRPELVWDRALTHASLAPAWFSVPARVLFKLEGRRLPRGQAIPSRYLDTPVERIIAAVNDA